MDKIENFLISGLDIPAEVLGDMPVCNNIGFRNLVIENFSSLLDISSESITLRSSAGNIIVSGEDLQISFLRHGELGVSGKIKGLYLGEKDV